ncbi:MAG: phosphoribosylformylglycinamidine synthase subunit PurQ [Chloroflexi bacterium]|nr:MAG: phosphoribosylformylglycinamidine synthase subunit PurQ [Chloroflexota bacterium]TMF24624.1 MAG: phosphoribosylformylglycinamidine synthase subunit PurQ [Chloroflexota bacterium]TMG50299.1 MAG: phosphoribosylformylglycinamidine synthase subunit PurQ [Chloroflexota bacterium]
MRTGIVVFPGTWSDRDCFHAVGEILGEPVRYVDHRERALDDLELVVLPGGFSYGDYLRCGAIARFAPVMEAVADFANRGGLVLGICNGFQILQEARLLPGALLRNASCEFRCEWVHLRVEQSDSAFTLDCRPGQVLRIPISHGEGNFFADAATLESLERDGRVVFRYCAPDGRVTAAANPNGSFGNIAGISNARGNVIGMMPHPERACEALLGSEDGLAVFRSAIHALTRVAV